MTWAELEVEGQGGAELGPRSQVSEMIAQLLNCLCAPKDPGVTERAS